MSLSSRLLSLSTADQSSPLSQPSESETVSQYDGFAEAGADFGTTRKPKRVRTMETSAEHEDIEMKRPPYLHVSVAPTSSYDNTALTFPHRQCWLAE